MCLMAAADGREPPAATQRPPGGTVGPARAWRCNHPLEEAVTT